MKYLCNTLKWLDREIIATQNNLQLQYVISQRQGYMLFLYLKGPVEKGTSVFDNLKRSKVNKEFL